MGNQQAVPSRYVRRQWVDDELADHCTNCLAKFTFMLRRHHCRCCGEVFCRKCWGRPVQLPEVYDYGGSPQRVCHVCFRFFKGDLKKLQRSRSVALVHSLKSQKHTPGPPLIPENFRPAEGELAGERGASSEPSTVAALTRTSSMTLNVPGTPRGAMRRSDSGVISPTKNYVEVFSIKLAHWRPVDKGTCILFCRNAAIADEVAQSSRKVKVTSEVVNRSEASSFVSCRDEDDRDAVWSIQLDAILSCVLESSLDHGLDYISIETAQEVYYIQVAERGPTGSVVNLADLCHRDAARFQPSQEGTAQFYKELKELIQLMEQRVRHRESLEEAGLLATRTMADPEQQDEGLEEHSVPRGDPLLALSGHQ